MEKEEEEEILELIEKQIVPFQSMDIADAFFFCFFAKTESTEQRTFLSATDLDTVHEPYDRNRKTM
jgi:hypothetical protein